MEDEDASRGAAVRLLFSRPPFRLFWGAVAASSVGTQFFGVALPWLVLQVSGSDVALGAVLMTAAVPRAGLVLAGGALSDRLPPARVLSAANLCRAILVGLAATLVVAGGAHVWTLYVLAGSFGILDALSGPASTAIVPRVAGYGSLPTANGVVQGTTQIGTLIAPSLAGLLIATRGSGASFAVSAAAFALAAAAFAMTSRARHASEARDWIDDAAALGTDAPSGGTTAVLRLCLRDPALRAYLVLIAALSLATSGPLGVGIPSLAHVRFGGSVGLGVMLSASGGGTLAGALLAGLGQRVRHRGIVLLAAYASIGVLLGLLAWMPTITAASVVIAMMACAASYANLVVTATLQAGVNRAILGRVMAILMLASTGLAPASCLLAGFASAVGPVLLFSTAGGAVMVATAHAALSPALRRVD